MSAPRPAPLAPLSAQLAAAVVQRFGEARVLVAGDVMLDRYWFGEVSRISPEAPVPVVHVQRSEERPGGAANVARGVAEFYEKYAIPADSFARMVAFAISQPEEVDINEILFRPTAQEL